MSKPDPKSYFDMSDKKKKKIIDKASKGAIEAQRDLIAKADSVAKQKECKCGKIGEHICGYLPQPDPSLNTWENAWRILLLDILLKTKKEVKGYPLGQLEVKGIDFIKSQISLAVQRERKEVEFERIVSEDGIDAEQVILEDQIALAVQKERERSKGGES